MEGIQELAFVLMQTLDLNIENRIHIHFHAADILQISGKPFLIGAFDGGKFPEEPGIRRKFFKLLQLGKILHPAISDPRCDESGKPLIQPF